jgi:hypothetical protein
MSEHEAARELTKEALEALLNQPLDPHQENHPIALTQEMIDWIKREHPDWWTEASPTASEEPEEPIKPEVLEELRRRARGLRAEEALKSQGLQRTPDPDPFCPHKVEVPAGPHQSHHVHQPRENRYECMTCRMTFRFVKGGTTKRRRLLR